ncbi:hypothetical protein DVR12_10415 [Chitinophaga silvatica]|uniref:Uncharacterized protein n=2 Tax=Chitinophaga silvatica TaxID=2282649 RepID=A0A3E1YBP5_9BACT|nr:hypothetical protein DVR12_10415 [Chitinophaga silvatica]
MGMKISAQSFTLKPVKLLPVPVIKSSKQPVKTSFPINPLAANSVYKQEFGFFCKQEWNWQKNTGLPIKLRLGNYDYTQKQEGKQ